MSATAAIPVGYCQCGCGQRTSSARYTNKRRGLVKGEPCRFAIGHKRCGSIDWNVFSEWLALAVREYGQPQVAQWGGVSTDRVRVLVRGYYWHRRRRYPIRRVTLGLVDRFLTGAGHPELLDEIAPLEDAA